MSDRFHSLTVVLEQDVKDEYAEGLIQAILRLRGVASVKGNVADVEAEVAEIRAKQELRKKLWDALK